jgi:hypothetical protein
MYEATGGLLRWRGVATLFLDANKPLVFAVNKGRRRCQTRSRPVSILNHPWCLCWIENSVGRRVVFTAALKKMPRHGGWRTDLGKGIADDLPLADNNGGIAITVARYETSTASRYQQGVFLWTRSPRGLCQRRRHHAPGGNAAPSKPQES